MERTGGELLAQLFELVVYGVVSAGISIGGLYAEGIAVTTATGGRPVAGAWLAFVGLVGFGFAYLVATDRLLPASRAFVRSVRG